ncbi:MAG: hypothetical protein ACJAYK_001298 [Crocinitomicaceae bacterium]|jgi:hypothetical protein
MKKIILLITTMLLNSSVLSIEVGGVQLPESIKVDTQSLALNGTGVRSKFFMDIYAAGLYLSKTSADAVSIIDQDKPMALRLHITSGLLSSEKMEAATREGFDKATGGNTASIQENINSFIETFKQEIIENDVFDFIYTPQNGVNVLKNGEFKKNIKGLEFKQALFGIWLSEDAISDDLKEGLLGAI